MKSRKWIALVIVCIMVAMTLIGCSGGKEAKYPKEDIKLVIPFSAGSAADVMSRKVIGLLKDVPVNVVPTNITGSGGLVGGTEAFFAKPNGYTLLAHSSNILVGFELMGTDDNKLFDNLTYICTMADDPWLLYVNADMGWKTIDEMVAWAKERPGELKFAISGGVGSVMATTLLVIDELGIEATAVPYDGSAESQTALLGGHVHARIGAYSVCGGDIKAGLVTALCSTAKERCVSLPDVPSLYELGYNVTIGSQDRSFFGPPNLDTEALDYLVKMFKAVSETAEYQEYCDSVGFTNNFRGPDTWKDEKTALYDAYQPVFDKYLNE